MKTYFLAICACLFMTTAYAQDEITTEKRTIESFEGIHVCCGIDLYLTEGVSSEITVTAKKEDLELITTEVKKGVLRVSYKNSKSWSLFKKRNKIKVEVTAQNLISLEASAGGSIEGVTGIQAKNIRFDASSGGEIQLHLEAENITCHASSGGDIELKGSAATANLSASSGGDIKLKDLTADSVTAHASSGGDVKISVGKEITADASSGGGINYYGNPMKTNVSSSSGGSVKKK
jgi:hypothetical protein